ncbi:MAG TPA: prolipoprotein diacylglyceryl transferase family protein [Acidimicrobiia bacterium]|nr:prolipoprotein diacylglyceryl transferase family protein [Acidimicrobiia bacterium]
MIFASVSYPPFPMIHLGGLHLSIHGVFIGLGILAGAWLASRRVERAGGDVAAFQAVLTYAVVGALIGARFLTVPAALLDGAGWGALNPLAGNFSILGGFTGGILAGWWRMRALGLPVWPTLDASAPGLALGTVIGRLGCLAIVEHLGTPTSLPWGYGVKPGFDVAPQHTALECTAAQAGADGLCGVYQPVAAYDLIGAAVLLLALVIVVRRVSLRPGQLFALWMAWYGLQRFLLDSLRSGDASIGPITWNQLSGLVAGMGGLAMVWWLGRRHRSDAAAEAPASLESVMEGEEVLLPWN